MNENLIFVARLAITQYHTLSVTDRIRLLDTLSRILPEDEAEQARHTAYLLEQAEKSQLQLWATLGLSDEDRK